MGDSQRVVRILGAGLAGSEAALQLADRGIRVELVEMRPEVGTAVHKTGNAAELVCSNSLKSTNPDSAAGMLKAELSALGSPSHRRRDAQSGCRRRCARRRSRRVFERGDGAPLRPHPCIEISRRLARSLDEEAVGVTRSSSPPVPLTEGDLAQSLCEATGADNLAFFDAAAPVVMAESLDSREALLPKSLRGGRGRLPERPVQQGGIRGFRSGIGGG